MDVSTVLDGDAISPLLDALAEPGVAAAGWRGANVDIDDAWRSVHGAGPGEVDVLLGYLMAVRKDAAISVGGPDAKARYYRNADLEFSLMLREAGGRLVVPSAELPCHQGRHHGYHDTDPGYGERESRRNYERLLRRFRGRTDLLAPR
jgi:GT2 family glycosyltransferase